MTDITGSRDKIQLEATDASSPVSEDLMTKIGGAVNYIIDNSTTQLGDIITSALTLAQFQTIRGNNWVRMEGQDVTGSDFAVLTGITTLPVQYGGGALVANEASIMTSTSGENKSHTHYFGLDTSGAGSYNATPVNGYTSPNTADQVYPEGGLINAAGGINVGMYIKINNEPT